MIGLLDFRKVISLTGFRSHVLHNLSGNVDKTDRNKWRIKYDDREEERKALIRVLKQ